MPEMLDDEHDGSYSISDALGNLFLVTRGMPLPLPTAEHQKIQPLEVAIRLLRDLALLHGYNQKKTNDNREEEDDDKELFEPTDALVQRIRTNDPKLTSLALRNIQILDRGQLVSCFRGFTQTSIQQATEALHTNHTIRSVSCRYEWRYPKRTLRLLRNDENHDQDANHGEEIESNRQNLRASVHNQITKLQERRFFEACVCLPHLESISLTGGNRWRVSHLITILESAKGLKKLLVRDVLIKSTMELKSLKRLLQSGTNGKSSSTRRSYAPIVLESIELTIEDQTDRSDRYWSTATATASTPIDDSDEDESSPFDDLLEALIASPNTKEIKLSKSVLSRFRIRPVHDVSASTLLKLARCQSLSRLVLSGISVEKGAVESMCESLMRQNGHLTHLEFYGCAFNQSVGQSGWNAMFRLIEHDPSIHIKASSLVYLQRRGNENSSRHPPRSTRANDGSNREPLHEHTIDTAEAEHSGDHGLSAFVRRPRGDFSFSLRDENGAQRHFRNRSLDVRFLLQEAGFFRLLRARNSVGNREWIDTMARVSDDSIALFYILRENPALCDRDPRESRASSPSSPLVAAIDHHRNSASPLLSFRGSTPMIWA